MLSAVTSNLPVSNLGPDTGHSEVLHAFLVSLVSLNAGQYLALSYIHFLQRPFQFTFHRPSNCFMMSFVFRKEDLSQT